MKIYLAGVEGGDTGEIKGLIDYAFYSYYYMRNSKTKLIKGAKSLHKLVFVDSGAHSFFSEDETLANAGVHSKKTKTKGTPEDYFKKYVVWLKENYQHYDYFAELDIGEIVGQKRVREWREILKKNGLYSKCVSVYHPSVMSIDDYKNMLKDSESKYVALEGDRSNRKRLPYNKLIKIAYDQGIKVHGFAMTKREVMKKYPFYSVDSTTWKVGVQYGTIPYFYKTQVEKIDYGKNIKKEKLLKIIKDIDLDKLYCKDKKTARQYLLQLGIKAYKLANKYYTKLWEQRNIKWDS